MRERNCRARLPSKSDSGRCENETVVGDISQRVKVEDVKTKLSCETSLKTESGRCEHEVFMRDLLQILKVQIVKMKPELAVPMRGRSDHDPSIAGTVSHPSAGQASPHKHLPRHVLSCKTQHFVHLLRLKYAFRARLPSKSESGPRSS